MRPPALWWRRRVQRRRALRRPAPPSAVASLPLRKPQLTFVPAVAPGSFQLPPFEVTEYRPLRPLQRPLPRFHDVEIQRRHLLVRLADEAVQQGVLRELPTAVEATVRLVVKPKGSQAKLMADARVANRTVVPLRPPRCVWPRPADVVKSLSALGSGPYVYVTVDIRRFFDSLRLPASLVDAFTTYITDPSGARRYFAYSALPFGWSWAPLVAQQVSVSLVGQWLRSGGWYDRVVAAVYFDDVLIAARADAAPLLARASASLVSYLAAHGLVVNRDKSILDPMPSVSYLGFNLHADGSATVASAISAARVRATLNGVVSRRTRAQVVGAIRWHRPRVSPWLRRLEMTLVCPRPMRTPRAVVVAASRAASIARTARLSPTAPIGVVEPGDLSNRTLVFSDASAVAGLVGIVVVVGTELMSVASIPIPRWVLQPVDAAPERLQQVAELYGAIEATFVALSLRRQEDNGRPVVVTDSTSALFTLLRGKARDLRRSVLLRRVVSCGGYELGYVRSEDNPADGPSRSSSARVANSAARAAVDCVTRPPGLWPATCIPITGLFRPPRRVRVAVPQGSADKPHERMKLSALKPQSTRQ